MTDHPRFEPVRGEPDKAHLNYNGGGLVDCVLRLIDWWLALRKSRPTGVFAERPGPSRRGRRHVIFRPGPTHGVK